MQRLASVVLLLPLVVGCYERPEPYCEQTDEWAGSCPSSGWGGGGGGGGTTDYPRAPVFKPTYVPAGDSCLVCPLAVGGTTTLDVLTNDAINPWVKLTGGPMLATALDIRDREETYALTTTSIEGDTNITMTSANYPTLDVVVPVRHVRDVVLDTGLDYEPATSNPALRNGMAVSIRLLGEPRASSLRPQYLVDATLSVSDPRMVETAWDSYELATSAGSHVIDVTGDSIGPRQLAFDTVGNPTTLEATVDGAPVSGGTSRVCFHTYRDDREVLSTVEIVHDYTDNALTIGPRNCVTVSWQVATRRVLTARAHGLETTVELALP